MADATAVGVVHAGSQPRWPFTEPFEGLHSRPEAPSRDPFEDLHIVTIARDPASVKPGLNTRVVSSSIHLRMKLHVPLAPRLKYFTVPLTVSLESQSSIEFFFLKNLTNV